MSNERYVMSDLKSVVVVPTYNEKENIKIIIPQIEKEFKKIKR